MAHHILVGTEMLLDYVCLLAKKKPIPMAHRMLNNTETILAKTSSCASAKAIPMAHAYAKATKHLEHISRSAKYKQPQWHIAEPTATEHCLNIYRYM